jgi:hypothetical protein
MPRVRSGSPCGQLIRLVGSPVCFSEEGYRDTARMAVQIDQLRPSLVVQEMQQDELPRKMCPSGRGLLSILPGTARSRPGDPATLKGVGDQAILGVLPGEGPGSGELAALIVRLLKTA